jgi:hypothetical protein
MKIMSLLYVLLGFLQSCSKDQSDVIATSDAKLLFSSGFEKGIYLIDTLEGLNNLQWPDYTFIKGTDSITGYTWPPTIWGSNTMSAPNGIHTINDDGGAAIENSLESIIGPAGTATQALFQRINYATAPIVQSPYQINNISLDPKAFYIRYQMKIDNTSLVANDTWRAIFQYKSDDWFDQSIQPGFRISAFISRNVNGNLYWTFQGDDDPSHPIWAYEVTESVVPVPREKWFEVEYFVKLSSTENGRAWMKVNGQFIGDHQGPNLGSSTDSINFMMLTQIYGNSYPMHQWIDDIEIWDDIPY